MFSMSDPDMLTGPYLGTLCFWWGQLLGGRWFHTQIVQHVSPLGRCGGAEALLDTFSLHCSLFQGFDRSLPWGQWVTVHYRLKLFSYFCKLAINQVICCCLSSSPQPLHFQVFFAVAVPTSQRLVKLCSQANSSFFELYCEIVQLKRNSDKVSLLHQESRVKFLVLWPPVTKPNDKASQT